jgi:hypothetical protein
MAESAALFRPTVLLQISSAVYFVNWTIARARGSISIGRCRSSCKPPRKVGSVPQRSHPALTACASRLTPSFSRTVRRMAARLSMLGFPFSLSMRCKLFAGLAVAAASPSNPTVALTRSRRNQAGHLRLSIEKQRRRFVEQCPRETWIAANALHHGLLKVPGQRHFVHLLPVGLAIAALRALYSENSASARRMSLCCRLFVPPPNKTIRAAASR